VRVSAKSWLRKIWYL